MSGRSIWRTQRSWLNIYPIDEFRRYREKILDKHGRSHLAAAATILPFDLFGQSIASLGDIDGDGITDIAIGAAGDDLHVSQGGAVSIYSF